MLEAVPSHQLLAVSLAPHSVVSRTACAVASCDVKRCAMRKEQNVLPCTRPYTSPGHMKLCGVQVWVSIAALLNYEVVRLNTVRD